MLRNVLACALCIGLVACRDSNSMGPTATTPVRSVLQGTVTLEAFQFAVIQFNVDVAGPLSSRTDWSNGGNDMDTAVLAAHCTVEAVLSESPGCDQSAAIASDDSSLSKPSLLSWSAQQGGHTLVILNWGPEADTASYFLEGFVSGASGAATSPAAPSPRLRTETFPFTLPAGSRDRPVVGSVQAGDGPLEVTARFESGFWLALEVCGSVPTRCTRTAGDQSPLTLRFDIPSDFQAGYIEAKVYLGVNVTQPPGDARGTVTFTYPRFVTD